MSDLEGKFEGFEPGPAEIAFAELVADVGDRLRRGEIVDPVDYPDFEDSLREILPTLRMVTELRGPAAPHVDLGRLGDFRIVREVGRGGMGVVYEAIEVSLGRRVALKVLPNASALDARQLRRFQIEAQAAASLQHPHIVEVYSTGKADGTPYYAMRFIEGRDLARVVRELRDQTGRVKESESPRAASARSRTPGRSASYAREVARMALQAAEALEHAHASDVVHRDIKPSNILLDEAGRVWITDFGLARIMGGLDLTEPGDLLGTPRYMSPEQALGRRGQYDGRSDVYSLGATMYELLTLEPAFPGDERLDVLRRIVQEDPKPPRAIDPTIPMDLETIILTAMAKAPADRYATAGDLAADLVRFLDDRPIRARRPSLVDRARKWARRRRDLMATVLAATICLALILALLGVEYTVRLQKSNALLEAEVARADRYRRLMERHAYVSNINLAAQAVDGGLWERAQEYLDAIKPGPDGDPRDFSWYFLRRLARRQILLLPGVPVPTHEVFLIRDGSRLLSRGVDQVLYSWNFPRLGTPTAVGTFDARELVFSPDGRIAVGDRLDPEGRRIELALWEIGGGLRMRFPLEPSAGSTDRYFHFKLIEGGNLLACAWQGDGASPLISVRIWRLQGPGREPRPTVALDGLGFVAFAPSGGRFVTLESGGVVVRDTTTGDVVWKLSGREDATAATAISDDGRWAAVSFPEGLVVVYDLSNGVERERRRLDLTPEILWFGPGDDVLAASDAAGAVHVWSEALGYSRSFDARDPLDSNDPAGVRALAFSADRRLLAVSPKRKPQGLLSVAVWDLTSGQRYGPPPSLSRTSDTLQFTPDGRALILGGPRSPRIWRDPPKEPSSPSGHQDEAWSAAFSHDGSMLATGSDDGAEEPSTIKIWDPSTSALLRGWFGGQGTVASIDFSPDGRTLVSGHLAESRNVRLWDVAEGKLLVDLVGHVDWVRTVAFSPDGSRLASGSREGKIIIWDVASRRILHRLDAHTNAVRRVAFSPDGSRLVSVSTSGSVRLWDPVAGSPRLEATSPTKLATVAFSPDGAQIATADEDGFIMIRDAATLALIRTIRGDIDVFFDIAFAADGRSVVTSSKSGAIRFWDTLVGQELLSIKGHNAQVNGLAFSPDGSILVSCGHDGSVRIWRAAPNDPYEPRPGPQRRE